MVTQYRLSICVEASTFQVCGPAPLLICLEMRVQHFIVVSAILLSVLRQAEAALSVTPIGSSVLISARIGEDASFVGGVELVSNTPVTELVFQPTELVRADGKVRIDRSQISLTNPGKLALDGSTSRFVAIKISGVKEPGTYTGKLNFYEAGKMSAPPLVVPIQIIVRSKPSMSMCRGSESLSVQRVRCWPGECLLSKMLEPKAFLATQTICLENSTLEFFRMDVSAQGRGTATQSPLGDGIKIAPTVDVPIGRFFELPITFGTPPLADHYTGSIALSSNNDLITKIPIDMNVRTGPVVPLLVLLIGILLGRLLKFMKERGTPQSDLLLALYQMEARLAENAEDQRLLQPMLESVKAQIYSEQLATAKAELDSIQNRWSLLNTLRGLENTIKDDAKDPRVVPILAAIADARIEIGLKQDQQAAAKVSSIQADIQALQQDPPRGATVMYSLAHTQANTARAIADVVNSPQNGQQIPRWVRVLSKLSGSSKAVRAELTLWIVRPLLYLILIVALCALGLQQLYLKNPTFGADIFGDYFGLLVWALSSDVASRTLSGLKSAG
jgi:hypothetical protein